MKSGIHPEFNINTKAKCACGRTFTIGSTLKEINIEICSNCHPFYTGVEKIVDTAGRVEKFKARRAEAASRQARREVAAKASTKKEKKVKERKTENK